MRTQVGKFKTPYTSKLIISYLKAVSKLIGKSPTFRDVHVVDKFGQSLPGWPQKTTYDNEVIKGPITLGDINNDNKLEIFTSPQGGTLGYTYAWDYNGNPLTNWPISTNMYFVGDTRTFNFQLLNYAPSIGHVTNDPFQNIAVIDSFQLGLLNKNGELVNNFWKSWLTSYNNQESPHILDLNNNGKNDLVQAGHCMPPPV